MYLIQSIAFDINFKKLNTSVGTQKDTSKYVKDSEEERKSGLRKILVA
jgi:hypothetical protein